MWAPRWPPALDAFIRGAGWMTAAQFARLLAQALTFVLIARSLGATGLGTFAAALAVVYLFFTFVGLGTGSLLVYRTARDPSCYRTVLTTALATTLATGVVLAPVAIGAGIWIAGLPAGVMAVIAISELLLAKLADLAAQAFQAHERLRGSASIALATPALRAVAAVALLSVAADPTATSWALLYLACAAVAGTGALVAAVRAFGMPEWPGQPVLASVRQGALFSVAHCSSMVSADIDKVMLARLDSTAAVGIYTAAYRATSFALVPIISLFWATYVRFFQRGRSGVRATAGFARRLLPASFAYGVASGVALYATAPFLAKVLGSGFADSAAALRWLAPLPVLTALGYLAADSLTGADRQGVRTSLQIGAAGLNICLNAVLIPAHSWRGAAWSTLVASGALVVALWLAVAVLARRERSAPAAVPVLDPAL